MKKSFYFILSVVLLLNISCSSKKASTNNISDSSIFTYKISNAFILLPIEESVPEIQINVQVKDLQFNETYNVRIARNETDYWMPLKVDKFKGKELILTFSNYIGAEKGISEIFESNKFEFDYNETYRPQFHFTPEYGWMNDPNGMVYLDGEYHLFYQYNPYGSVWGNMHWGHAVSTDLTSWTYLPIALSPDGLGAIYSGSAVIDVNNTAGFGANAMVAIYTNAGEVQAQSIAYSTDKGRTFTKYVHNPVIPNIGIVDFRDPKVSWNEAANQWVMALATKQTITFYSSPNLKDWTRLSEFGEGIGSHAGVWECPDLFSLQYNGKTKWLLLVSINPGGPNGGSATQYFIGNFDGKTFTADKLPYPLWIDYGRDNYAGVTFSNIPKNDGRRIFMGWMSNWNYGNIVPTSFFRSANTVPRDLSLVNNGDHLILNNFPTKEISKLRTEPKTIANQTVEKELIVSNLLPNKNGTYEIEMTLIPQKSTSFGFELMNSKSEKLSFVFDLGAKTLKTNREKSGKVDFSENFKNGSVAPLLPKESYRIRLLIDKASAEIFVNDGQIVMSNIFFPTETMNNLKFFNNSGILKANNITVYNIK